MKTILLSALFFFALVTGLNAQDYYIKAGNSYLVVGSNGAISLDSHYGARLSFYTENGKYRIFEKKSSRFLYPDLKKYHQLGATLSSHGSLFGLENNPGYNGWLIYRYFPDGKKYYLVSHNGLRWLSNLNYGMPAIMYKWKTAGSTHQNNGQNTQTRKPKPRTKTGTDTRKPTPKWSSSETKKKSGYGKPARKPAKKGKKVYGKLYIDCKSKAPCSPFGLVVTVRGVKFKKSLVFNQSGDVFNFGDLPVGRYQVYVGCNGGKLDSARIIPKGKEIVIHHKQTTTVRFDF